MKNSLRLLCLAVCVSFACGQAWAKDAVAGKLGTKVADFALQDFRGAPHKLSDAKDAKLVVVAFLGVECPLSKLYAPRLAELAKTYEAQGVKFLALDPNQQDAITEMGHFAKEHGIEFPFLKDLNNKLADSLGAARVPHVFLLDADRAIRYSGRIDDQYGIGAGSGYAKPQRTTNDLANAIDELLAGKAVSKPETEALGCLIGRVRAPDNASEVTYSNQIARIFQDRCVDCHRAGQIGPFALESYEDAVGWAEMIDEVVRERRMPPWHPDPAFGHWKNDASLSAAERETIAKWVAAGAPRGNPQDLPKKRAFKESWLMEGGPDVVIYMTPEPVNVKAEGTENYRYYTAETSFAEDKWISCAECMPGNRSVVHHIIVSLAAPAAPGEEAANQRRGGGGAAGGSSAGGQSFGWLSVYAPGTRPYEFAPGMARLIPAGYRVRFQMHYTPNGTAATDRSAVGLKFVDPDTVKYRVATSNAANASFVIPANDPAYKVESNREYKGDVLLVSLFPHMHLRGKDFHYEVLYPDGTKETLLNMPRYDFNWQTNYVYTDPKPLPAGTKLHCTAHFDNSSDNKANPDPDNPVRWGDQTWEEMMIGWFDIAIPKDKPINEVITGGGIRGPRNVEIEQDAVGL